MPPLSKARNAEALLIVTFPVTLNCPVVQATVLELKATVGSVAPASNVQVNPEPEPKVVVPISVVSRLIVKVSVAVTTVSMPFVPPTMLAVSLEEMV